MISPFASPEMSVVSSIVLLVEAASVLLCTLCIFEHQRIERRYARLLSTISEQKSTYRNNLLPMFYLFSTITAVLLSTALYLWSPSVLP